MKKVYRIEDMLNRLIDNEESFKMDGVIDTLRFVKFSKNTPWDAHLGAQGKCRKRPPKAQKFSKANFVLL